MNMEKTKMKMKMVICDHHYLPKDETLGEDANFISEDHQFIGVADGVGSWAAKGVDAGEYARRLMRHSLEAVLSGGATQSPKQILAQAFAANAEADVEGSSTACILRHDGGVLHAANVGDSGFVLFRNGAIVFRSPAQQRRFNAPFQLGNALGCDTPERAWEVKIAVIPGDVVVLGTDGVFDNLFGSEIERVLRSPSRIGAAFRLGEIALRYSLETDRKTPFSQAATAAGRPCIGGKFDDITVIVARIVRDDE